MFYYCWYRRVLKIIIVIFFSWYSGCAISLSTQQSLNHQSLNASALSLDMDNMSLTDAIQYLAKFLHVNVIVSQTVHGVTSLHLHHDNPLEVLRALLMANGLAVWQMHGIWWIAPEDEVLKRKQEEVKWRESWDALAVLPLRVWQIKYAKAEEIAHLLHDEQASFLSKQGHVRADARTNTIYVQDQQEHLIKVNRMIRALDTPIAQIVIKATLASVDSDFERELGINFSVQPSYLAAEKQPTEQKVRMGHYSLAIAKLADGSSLEVKLAALERAGRAQLISAPSLFTANQQPASIEAGEEVPYQEVSESGGTAVVFKKAVLGLKVIPHLWPGNKVSLELQINQDRPSNKTVLGMPTISTRQITTQVLLRNGETIVLGGIYETNREQGEERLPFISRLPLIGLLFQQHNIRINKRELLIFVTPKVIT